MTNKQKIFADHVVEEFQSLLDSDTSKAIGEQNFEALNSLVREAIAEHTESIMEQFESVLKNARKDLERRPLEL